MAKLSLEHFIPCLAKSAYQNDNSITFIVRHSADCLLAWCLLSSRIKSSLGIRNASFIVETFEEAFSIGHQTTVMNIRGPIVLIGIEYDLSKLASDMGEGHRDIYHFATKFTSQNEDDAENAPPNYFQMEAVEALQQQAVETPLITTYVGMALMNEFPTTGLMNLIFISAAAQLQIGVLSESDYRKLVNIISVHELFTSNEQKSYRSSNNFPGLFFNSMTMRESFENSSLIQRHLHDWPIESRTTEVNNIRVRFGLSSEEWSMTFRDLPHRRQASVLKSLRQGTILDVELKDTTKTSPVFLLSKKTGSEARNEFTNMDLAFMFNCSLGGISFEGRKLDTQDGLNRKRHYLNMIRRVSRMTENARYFKSVYTAFSSIIGTEIGPISPPWHEALRTAALENAIATYKKIGDRMTSIYRLIFDSTCRSEKEVSSAFRVTDGLYAIYLTETAYLPLSYYETRCFLVSLSNCLKDSIAFKSADIVLLHAGHGSSRLSWCCSESIGNAHLTSHRDTFIRIAQTYSHHNRDQFALPSFHVNISSELVWQLFATKLIKSVKRNRNGDGPSNKRRKAANYQRN